MSDSSEQMLDLCLIMQKVHIFADRAWSREVTPPEDILRMIMDIQATASVALGLPPDLPLMTGDPRDL